jgi:hypothetical protein
VEVVPDCSAVTTSSGHAAGQTSPDSGEYWIAESVAPCYSDRAQRSVCIAERPNGLIKARSVIGSAGSRSSARAHAGTIETALAAKT